MSEKELEALFKKRQLMINQQQKRLLRTITGIERKLLERILTALLTELRTEGGRIKSGRNEIKLSEAIDRIFDAFDRSESSKLVKDITADFKALFTSNNLYYKGLFDITGKAGRYAAITEKVQTIMRNRIGIDENGKMQAGGYFDSLIKNTPLRNKIKELTFRAVTSEMGLADFTRSLRDVTVGGKGVPGNLQQYYKGAVFDTYQQFDRATNTEFAFQLKLTCFIYSGGLIETSRDFCVNRNNKVFTEEETEEWKNDKTLPRTKKEKDSGVVSGYMPLLDFGRWNCRHMSRYISDQMALRMRPDLQVYFDKRKKLRRAA